MAKNTDPMQMLNDIPASGSDKNGKALPPVHLWNPTFCGDIDMRLASDGRWFYQGTPILRERMVRLFSTILRKDGDEYFLVTPVEKVRIKVDDAPFVATLLAVKKNEGKQALHFTTNVGDEVIADSEHGIRVIYESSLKESEPRPYIHVRAGLDALISRSVFYQLVDLAYSVEQEGESMFAVDSCGERFILGS